MNPVMKMADPTYFYKRIAHQKSAYGKKQILGRFEDWFNEMKSEMAEADRVDVSDYIVNTRRELGE